MRPIRQYIALLFCAFGLLGLGLYVSAFARFTSSIPWQLHFIGAVSVLILGGAILCWRGLAAGRYLLGAIIVVSFGFWSYEFVWVQLDTSGGYRFYESLLVQCFLLGTHAALILLLRHHTLYEQGRQLPTRDDVLDM